MVRIAEALKCNVADLYDDPDPSGSSVSERTILKLWGKLREAERDAVVAMIREFVKR